MDEIVGRQAELQAVQRFLRAARERIAALVIEGEPGIGKTTIWRHAIATAQNDGFRVLQARPAESEAKLSYVALADLVGGAFVEVHATLPEPQQRALGAALLRDDVDEPADPRTTATALAGVVSALADEGPTLLAIDDVQWLDRSSERALEFTARRLPAHVGLLLTRRSDGDGRVPIGLDRALAERDVETIVPRPLSVGALHHLIRDRLGTVPSRPILVRIAATSGGNPFFALELARALERGTSARALADPLPVPERLQTLVGARVRALSRGGQNAALLAAALSRPTIATMSTALAAIGEQPTSFVEAEEAGVLVTERDRIRFSHPLLAAAVYDSASGSRRRELHARLAEIVADPEERARHLAQSTTEPDEAAATEIELAADRAARRGAPDAAAELYEASCRLTPGYRRDAQARRLRREAATLLGLGDVGAARARADGALAASSAPAMRAKSLALLARIAWVEGAIEVARELLEKALTEAAGDRELEARILARMSFVTLDPRRAIEYADAALRLLSEEREPGLVAAALITRFAKAPEAGESAPHELFERGLELEARARLSPAGDFPSHPSSLPLIWFQCVDDFGAARARHAFEEQWYSELGNEGACAERLAWLALVELRAGRWDLAEQYIESSATTVEQLDAGGSWALPAAWRSFIDAHRGRLERGRATLLELIADFDATDARPWTVLPLSILGFVEFAAGDHAAVDRALTEMRARLEANGAIETLLDRSEPLHVESLVALGQLGRARDVLDRLQERGRRLPRMWIDVTLPRARALVLAAEGDLAGALEGLDELDIAQASQLPFELAWARLLKGRLHRRLKQKRASAEALGEALEIFDRLGSPPWTEWTRRELGRVGLRRAPRWDLTDSERRVAELAAAGRTNREIAQALFISPKTVEANLARVYRKLAIASRAELGARMGGRA